MKKVFTNEKLDRWLKSKLLKQKLDWWKKCVA